MPTYRTVVIEPQERRFRDKRTKQLRIEWTERKVFFVCQNCAHVADVKRPWDFACRCDCHSPELASTYQCGECDSEFDTLELLTAHINEPHSSDWIKPTICTACIMDAHDACADSGIKSYPFWCECASTGHTYYK